MSTQTRDWNRKLAQLAQQARAERPPQIDINADALRRRMLPAPSPIRLMFSSALGSGLAAAVAVVLTLNSAQSSNARASTTTSVKTTTQSVQQDTTFTSDPMSELFSPLELLKLP